MTRGSPGSMPTGCPHQVRGEELTEKAGDQHSTSKGVQATYACCFMNTANQRVWTKSRKIFLYTGRRGREWLWEG